MATWYMKSGDLPYLNGWKSADSREPYPKITFRMKSGDLPYKLSWENISECFAPPYSSVLFLQKDGFLPYKYAWRDTRNPAEEVQQDDYICIYDMNTPQNEFDTNGKCVLVPSICEITEELNGSYELYMEHPFDEEGRWKTIIELDIIKANGQLFRIYKYNKKISPDGNVITINARHIFYDLNDPMLFYQVFSNLNGQELITFIMERMFDGNDAGEYTTYDFSGYSDITDKATGWWEFISPVACLMGADNCLINMIGGEIYRNNFYFSINKSREKAVAEAFDIQYGFDMVSIDEDIDYTDMCSYFVGKNNFGASLAVARTYEARLHRPIIRGAKFNYSDISTANDSTVREVYSYYRAHMYPTVTFRIDYVSLPQTEEYKEFWDIQRCEVGDTGYVTCERLGIRTLQKVVKKTFDVLSKKTTSIELGNKSTDLTRPVQSNISLYPTAAETAAEATANQAKATMLKLLGTHADMKKFKHSELRMFKHKELRDRA